MPSEDLRPNDLPLEPTPEAEASGSKRSSFPRKPVAVIVLLAVAAFVVWRIHATHKEAADAAQKAAAAANRPTPVLVAEVQQRTMPIYYTALGTVTAYNTVTIKSRVDGQLVKVNFVEGQHVHKGELLLQIDPAPYQAAVAQAEGQYAKDLAAVKNGQAEAARYTALYQAGVVSKESEQAQVSTSGQAEGALKADLAAIQAAKVNLAYTRITSPIDGQVGLRQVDVGNIVHASDTNGLVVVTQLQPISVIFTLPEEQLPEVRQRLAAGEKLVADAYDRGETIKLASGTLLTIDNQIDATTGMDKLKAIFTNQDQALFPNQFVNIRLILEQKPNVIVVPTAAMQTGSNGSFVYVVTPKNTVEARPIVTTVTEGSVMLVDSGLQAGERVVIDGQEKLKPGSNVVVGQSGGKRSGQSAAQGGNAAAPTPNSGDAATSGQPHTHGGAAGQKQ